MKRIAIIILMICTLIGFNSCDDEFLDVSPYGVYSQENLRSKEAVDNLLTACYSAASGEMISNQYCWLSPSHTMAGEAHAGCIVIDKPKEALQFNLNAGITRILYFWTWLYDAVFRCNQVIEQLELADMTDAEKTEVEAEARFLRAHFHFLLKRAFYNVPWIENTDDILVPNTENNDGKTFVNIWPQIAADMDFARKNLPATQTEIGRVNKWAAECYYAKIMIYRANFGEYSNGYSEALTVLNDVMANGVTSGGEKYALLDNYYHVFSGNYQNSAESVLAIQCSVNDGTTQTTMFGASPNGNGEPWLVGSGATSGPTWGTGIGWGCVSFWVVDHFRTTENGLPYLDYFETNPNSVKNDYQILSTEPYEPDNCPLDPRVDWTVGRRGIPFLDYGINPGIDWIPRGQDQKGPYLQKKVFVRSDEAGIYTKDKVNVASAVNVYIIRYADVLLLASECNARLGNLDEARDLVNQIRGRMINNSDSPDNWVKMEDGSNAANYLISLYPADGSAEDAFTTTEDALDAILYERMLELACEGHRFFDVVRFEKDEEQFPLSSAHNAQWLSLFDNADYTRTPDRFLPIPREAIDNSQVKGIPTLTQSPGY